MNKSTDIYLDCVIELYKDFIKKGEIIPLEFNFPSFTITKGVFNHYAVEAFSERVKIGVDSGKYGLQKYSEKINYEDLVDYSLRKKKRLNTLKEDQTIGFLIDTLLKDIVKKDTSITANDIRKAAFTEACVKTMDYKVQELINFEYFNIDILNPKINIRNENSANEIFTETIEKVDFLATLVSMKEMLPQVYKQVLSTLNMRKELSESYVNSFDPENKSTKQSFQQNSKIIEMINDLKDKSAKPNINILERALKKNPELLKNFVEHYPKSMKEILRKDNVKNINLHI